MNLDGHNLGLIAVEAANLRLEKIRAMAAHYSDGHPSEPFIQQIEVRTAGASNEDSEIPTSYQRPSIVCL